MMPRLAMQAAAAKASGGEEFSSTIEVSAKQLAEAASWTTANGSVLRGKAGDWLVSDGQTEWTVDEHAFDQTYVRSGAGRWRKPAAVRAVPVEVRCEIETAEGVAVAEAGDWLLTDDTGNAWPIAAREFEHRYAPVVRD